MNLRKIVIILLFIVEALIIFDTLFQTESSIRFNDYVNSVLTSDSHAVTFSVDKDGTTVVYDAISSLSNQYSANVIVSDSRKNDDGRSVFTNYVYISQPEFYQNFTYEGIQIHLTNNSDQFLSTEATGDPRQIGRLVCFSEDFIFEIGTLRNMLNGERAFNLTCIIQIENKNFTAFCDAFYEQTGIVMLQTAKDSPPSMYGNPYAMMTAMVACLHLIMILVVIYGFAKNAKNIAVEKMLGHWRRSIWGGRILRLLRDQALTIIAVYVLMSIARLQTINAFTLVFLQKLAFAGVLVILSTLAFSVVTLIIISRVSIVGVLKNLRLLRFIVIFNMTVKIALMALIVFLGHNALAQYSVASSFHVKNYADWEKTRDLYTIPGIINVSSERIGSEEFSDKMWPFYTSLNRNGSIVAVFDIFKPKSLELNSEYPFIKYVAATINSNYLKDSPVYDTNGSIVRVDEEAKHMVLLVPEAFRAEEAKIREYYELVQSFYEEKHTTIAGVKMHDQQIDLIWVKNDQKYFTYDLTINPNEGNTIENIILSVLTENNGFPYDYGVVMGWGLSAMKIKTLSADPKGEIHNMAKEYGFEDNVSEIISVYNIIAYEVEVSLEIVRRNIFVICIMAFTLVMIIIQNIYNYFDRHKRLISIKTFMGHSFRQKYGPFFLVHVAATWAVIIAVSFLLNSSNLGDVMMLVLICAATEVLLSLLTIVMTQKKRILNTLKGGN